MAKKQWSTTFNEDILKDFQTTCDKYGMKANTVLELLMTFFAQGKCKIVINMEGMSIEVTDK